MDATTTNPTEEFLAPTAADAVVADATLAPPLQATPEHCLTVQNIGQVLHLVNSAGASGNLGIFNCKHKLTGQYMSVLCILVPLPDGSVMPAAVGVMIPPGERNPFEPPDPKDNPYFLPPGSVTELQGDPEEIITQAVKGSYLNDDLPQPAAPPEVQTVVDETPPARPEIIIPFAGAGFNPSVN
jgi:hypothetical protein